MERSIVTTQIKLKYGCNPHQSHAQLTIPREPSPLKVLNGKPGYINLLDLLGAWQLAHELKQATGLPGAASFKHVSPAGAAVARPLDDALLASQMLKDEDYSPVATAYIRARAGDRLASFGDVAAVSDVVDVSLAQVLKREVSDAIIAPGYEPEALEILKEKKQGGYLVVEIDPDYEPPAVEDRDLFGFRLEQSRNSARVGYGMLEKIVTETRELPPDVAETLLVATIALKYTQSNSVCVAYDGQVIGMGAGQQSRIHCTRLACSKADKWFLQQHPRVLGLPFAGKMARVEKTNIIDQFLLWDELSDHERRGIRERLTADVEPLTPEERREWIGRYKKVALSSDAFLPFRDNVDRASRSGVRYLVHAGGSLRDDEVTAAANEYGMVMVHTGMRWFLH
jgi:AICAR transformylase/IMP cyclohydrolase PurH